MAEEERTLPDWLDDDDRAAFRAPLEADLKGWKQQWQALELERRAKEAQYQAVLRDGSRSSKRPRAYDQGRVPINWDASTKNELAKRLAQIDFEQQTLEGSIREAISLLDELPESVDDTPETDDAAGASAEPAEDELDDEPGAAGSIVPLGRPSR